MKKIDFKDLKKYRKNTRKNMERILNYNWKKASDETVAKLNESNITSIPPFSFTDIGYRIVMRIADICYILVILLIIGTSVYALIYRKNLLGIVIFIPIVFSLVIIGYINVRKNYGKEFLEKAKSGDFKELDVDATVYYNGFSYGPQTKSIFTHVWTIFHDENSIYPDDYGCWLMYRGDIFGKTKKALLFEHEDNGKKIYEIIILLY